MTQTETSYFNIYDYKRSRSSTPIDDEEVLDLSYLNLTDSEPNLLAEIENKGSRVALSLMLNNNLLKHLPPVISFFQYIQTLDISGNQFKVLSEELCSLTNLKYFFCKENALEDNAIPKNFRNLSNLEVVNFSGNLLTQFPYQLLEMSSLREIFLGSNKISVLPRNYEKLQRLEILYLGGNQIKAIPEEMRQLRRLSSLNLSNNCIKSLPNKLAKLKSIKTLALHGNNLTTLPIELVKLNLQELSLRDNPLVAKFAKSARDFSYNVPSLLELSGRVIKSKGVAYSKCELPAHLVVFLNSAQCCLNPKCKGVYFTTKVEHIKFVDFCGKYRVPLMQYLCSSACNEKIANKEQLNLSESSEASSSDSDTEQQQQSNEDKLLKKILFG